MYLTALLERLHQGARLTAAGRASISEADTALAATRRFILAGRRTVDDFAGDVHVATVYSMSLGMLPIILGAWCTAFPSLDVKMSEYSHAEALAAAMRLGHADLAIGPRPSEWTGASSLLVNEEFVVLMADNLAVSAKPGARVDLRDLAKHQWIQYASSNGLNELVMRACHAAGFEPRIAVRTEQTSSVLSLAQSGLGIALVPESVVPSGFVGQSHRPEDPVIRELICYTRGAPDPLARRLIESAVREVHARL